MADSTNSRRSQPLRVCQSCGSLIPIREAKCVQCGAVTREIAAAQDEALREAQFAGDFFSRATPFTWIFFGINIAIYLLMCFSGGPWQGNLIVFGAKLNSLIQQHQYWRFVTPIFIHANLIHLLFNSYGLYALGPAVEKLYGPRKFVFLYIASGIASVAASYRFPWVSADAPSVGASGALFGLIGILTVFGFKYRNELPGQFKKAFGARLLPVIFLNLMIGFLVPVIDNSAHIGGLIAGGILGSFVPYAVGKSSENRGWLVAQILCLGLVFASFVFDWTHEPRPAFSVRDFDIAILTARKDRETVARFDKDLAALNDASKSFAAAFNRGDPAAAQAGIEALHGIAMTGRPEIDPGVEKLSSEMISILGRLNERLITDQAAHQQPDAKVLGKLRCERDDWIQEYKDFGQKFDLGWQDDPAEQLNPEPKCSGNQS